MRVHLSNKYKLHLTHIINNKILHKVKKQWIIISFSTIALLLGTMALPSTIHADTTQNKVTVRSANIDHINANKSIQNSNYSNNKTDQVVRSNRINSNNQDKNITNKAKNLHQHLLRRANNRQTIQLGGRHGRRHYRKRHIKRHIRRRRVRRYYRKHARKHHSRRNRRHTKHTHKHRRMKTHNGNASSKFSSDYPDYSGNQGSDTPLNPDKYGEDNRSAGISDTSDNSMQPNNVSNSDNYNSPSTSDTTSTFNSPSSDNDGSDTQQSNNSAINSDVAYNDGYNDAYNLLFINPKDTSSNTSDQNKIANRGTLILNNSYLNGFIEGAKSQGVSNRNTNHIISAYLIHLDKEDSPLFNEGWSDGLYDNQDANVVTSSDVTSNDFQSGWYYGNVVDCGGSISNANQNWRQFLDNREYDEDNNY